MRAWEAPLLDSGQVELITDQPVAFIGDVHGHLDRLRWVLAQPAVAEAEQLVFLGDLIDRGPDSSAVVGMVRGLIEEGRAQAIIGNHEYALVRGLGLPAAGIPANLELFTAWCERYGGDETCASYGIDWRRADGQEVLREALGEDLDFIAALPWFLWGVTGDKPWLAVHAGLDERGLVEQLSECAPQQRWLRQDLPRFLYAKDRRQSRAHDLGDEVCLVSGHTPVEAAQVSPQRILADTSGGRPGRSLSAVLWPSGQVIASPAAGPSGRLRVISPE
ncbi:MAG: hypothetical protein EA402_07215 [Planctomycetota bacterium]|nr:MAG: hypothetical protein EA402_07215 [Planctomycetota bacterium]